MSYPTHMYEESQDNTCSASPKTAPAYFQTSHVKWKNDKTRIQEELWSLTFEIIKSVRVHVLKIYTALSRSQMWTDNSFWVFLAFLLDLAAGNSAIR